MKKLLFFDIDGTLAIPGRAPSEATVRAIRRARGGGHKAFLSTGRPQGLVPPAVAAIGFDGGIYSAGGQIVAGDTVIFDQAMPKDMTRLILEAVSPAADVYFTLECGEKVFRSEPGADILRLADRRGGNSEVQRILRQQRTDTHIRPLAEYRDEPVYKVGFMCTSGQIIDGLRQRLDERVKLVHFGNLLPDFPLTAGEISDRRVNKGNALRQICRHFGANAEDCIAFGDSMNDAEMLQTAGLGIVMGNAEEAVKCLANHVCESCEDDGVAKMLVHLGVI